ncbi:DUF4837 family protein [Calditrichota bacterium]
MFLFTIFTLLSSCTLKPLSRGNGGELVVVADEEDRPVIRKLLESTFGIQVKTPQSEALFRIIWIEATDLEFYTRSPLILIANSIDATNETSSLVNKMLSVDVRNGVNNQDYAVFKLQDPWARGQLLLLLLGKSKADLGDNAVYWADSLLNWSLIFEHDRLSRKVSTISSIETYNTEFKGVGFSFLKPPDYITAQENDSLNFVRYIRHYPERWFMIRWGKIESNDSFDAEYVYIKRSECNDAFLDPVDTYADNWSWKFENFNNYDAIKVRGLWAAEGPSGGGPFFSYGIVIPEKGVWFLLDGAVLAPGESKMPYLWQLEAIAHSFSIVLGE